MTTDVLPKPRTQHQPRTHQVLLAVAPAVVVLILGLVAFDGVRRTGESRRLVAHARDVMDRAAATLSTLQDAETGQRGFVITGDTAYLEPYEQAAIAVRSDTLALRQLIDDGPQQAQLDTLGILIHDKMNELAETITLRRDRGLDTATKIVRTDRGKRSMDEIRRLLDAIAARERTSLDEHQALEARRGRVVTLILLIGTLTAVVLALLLNGTLVRSAEIESRLAADLEVRNALLEEQSLELELQTQQLQDQAIELETQNEELQSTSEAMSEQAVELEMQAADLDSANRTLAEEKREADLARTAAETANRAKSDFLAMMSHELRTPLNAIAGYTQLMQLGVPEPVPASHQEYLARIQHSQHHLLGVINSVLNFARIEAGAVVYDIQDVAVGTLLGSVEPLIGPQIQVRKHHYECLPCERDLVIRADGDKVTQVLLNLLSNAIKFTPPGGAITLSAEHGSVNGRGVAVIRVRDTGPGIPPDKLATIFDPFVQVDTSLSRTTDGAGLGLAISRDLARGMNGDLSVESEMGTGSTFTLTLPLADTR